jgi:bla regulator protein BlaR1
MTHYIIQTIVFQTIFLALYEFLLKKETFFQWNRAYLIGTSLLSLCIPFIKIPVLQTFVPQNIIISLPEVTLGAAVETSQNLPMQASNSLSTLEIILLVGIFISALLFFEKLFKIIQLKRKGKRDKLDQTEIVILPNSDEAFSFLNTIYLGENFSAESKKHIIAHELVHIHQKHYLDLLYFEILRMLFWFNPILYLYQKRIAALHEFIADAEVVSKTDKLSYYQNLLSEVFKTHTVSFINTFFNQSLIKKRIDMLHQSKFKKVHLFKFVILLPLVMFMLVFISCAETENTTTSTEKSLIPNATVVIDTVYGEVPEDLVVPFAVIDEVPVYPGCENSTFNEERKKCFSESIDQLIKENFNVKVVDGKGLTGRIRVAVQFRIDKDGNIVDLMSRAPDSALETEAKRVIGLIPKVEPGKHKGEEVSVLYSLPILFEIPE